MKQHELIALAENYGSEYLRTTGRKNKITYDAGWFTLPNGDKARPSEVKKFTGVMKVRPTYVPVA